MLQFQNLSLLDKHQKYLSKKLASDDFFLVGGCIRDLLLGINENPKDIDLTMAGDPQKIYKNLDKKNISHFITEKFWTITIIPRKQWKVDELLQYELTPFRKETWYSDNRHPDVIERSNNILEDAKRREFTISCIYYYNNWNKWTSKNNKKIVAIQDTEKLKKNLETHGFDYLWALWLWIVQDNKLIEKLFPKWKLSQKSFDTLIDRYAKVYNTNKPANSSIQMLVDPYNGLHDLINGKLKCVDDPDRRFGEDALRLIRALRFVNVINQKLLELWNNKADKDNTNNKHYLDFEKETRKSIQKNFSLIQYMAKERIKIELDKVFKKGNPFGFIALLDEVNMLKYLFPSVYAMKYVDQPVRYHPFDVYHHTLMTLFYAQSISKNPLVRRAMLYHDVGKVDQYHMYTLWLSREEIQKMHYLNHRNTSGKIAAAELKTLGFSKKEIEEIVRYIDHHHKPEEILNAKIENREKKIRKLLSEWWISRMRNLFDVVLWDRMWHYNPIQPPEVEVINDLKLITERLFLEEWQFTMKDLAVDGDIIMKQFKLKASPKIWALLKSAFDRTMQDIKKRNTKQKILTFLKSL